MSASMRAAKTATRELWRCVSLLAARADLFGMIAKKRRTSNGAGSRHGTTAVLARCVTTVRCRHWAGLGRWRTYPSRRGARALRKDAPACERAVEAFRGAEAATLVRGLRTDLC